MVCYHSAIKLGWIRVHMFRKYFLVAALAAGIAAGPAAGQPASDAERLVSAVKDRNVGQAVMVLRDRPLVINARNHNGETALSIAVARRDDEWTSFLLSKGADPNAPASNGDTPLIIAARMGYTAGATHLASLKAKIDAINRKGETALIVAVQQRNLPIVRMLLSVGADPDKTDNVQGYSARDYAKRDPRARDILRLIETRKPQP